MVNIYYYFQGESGESIDTPNAFVIQSSSSISFKVFLDYFNSLGNTSITNITNSTTSIAITINTNSTTIIIIRNDKRYIIISFSIQGISTITVIITIIITIITIRYQIKYLDIYGKM